MSFVQSLLPREGMVGVEAELAIAQGEQECDDIGALVLGGCNAVPQLRRERYAVSQALGVMVQHLAQRRKAPVMHVRERELDVAQRGDLELQRVNGGASDHHATHVAIGRIDR